ncbi:MAG: DUF1786 family protein [Candidatus Bathyarchaeia archaeon]
MKILVLDIGSGTEDILLHDDSRDLENCIKMVLPSPSIVYAGKVRCCTELRRSLFVRGDTIGGGGFVEALKRHLDEGLGVTMTVEAGYSVRNSLEEVRRMGIRIICEEYPPRGFEGEVLQVREVNIDEVKSFLNFFGEDLSDIYAVGIGVQDHGASPAGTSNRKFRMIEMERRLRENPTLEGLVYKGDEVPNHHVRMRSAARRARNQLPKAKLFIMDTSIASILGCLQDPKVREAETVLTVNIGNEHFTVSIVSEGEVLGLLEHHTHMLTPTRLEGLLTRFMEGRVDGESILDEGGHGAFYTRKLDATPKVEVIAVTGPNRARICETRLQAYFAAPGGDVMMTGPIGLVEAVRTQTS